MTPILLITHLPLLRMRRDDDFPLGPGVLLTKIPFDQYDELTQGAFTDWKSKYEATDPVFLWAQMDLELPNAGQGAGAGMLEMKIPPNTWDEMLPRLGLQLVSVFHEGVVDPVLAALALAAPAGVAAPPRDSVTFIVAAGENHIVASGSKIAGYRVQGNTDQELVYLSEAAATPLPDQVLERARDLQGLARFALANPDLGPTLRHLMSLGIVSFSEVERTLLAVAALEDLLLPDVRVENGKVLGRRISNLLGRDDQSREKLEDTARQLYRLRNASIHAEEIDQAGVPVAAAEQLLAGAIETLAPALKDGMEIEELRRSLDEAPWSSPIDTELPVPHPPGRGARTRMRPARPWVSATVAGSGRRGEDGRLLGWSPLIGLEPTADLVHERLGVTLTNMDGSQLVSMEEKDIRRDFISQLHLAGPVAAALVTIDPGERGLSSEATQLLSRRRDLATVGLRLAGCGSFSDPELLGLYVYERTLRHRRETVFRQSVLMQAGTGRPTQPIPNTETLTELTRLADYDQEARDDRVDGLLDLYRRAFDRRFLHPSTRATLVFVLIEAMLGSFRKPTSPKRLEAMVGVLPGLSKDEADWFVREARQFRKGVAHAIWQPAPIPQSELHAREHLELEALLAVAGAGVRTMLDVWTAAAPPQRAAHPPQKLIARFLSGRLES